MRQLRPVLLSATCLIAAGVTTACAFLQVPAAAPTPAPGARSKSAAPAGAKYVDPVELASNPSAFVGQTVWLQGEALNVYHNDEVLTVTASFPSFTWLRLAALQQSASGQESVAVEFYPQDRELTAGQCYRIYGTVVGAQDGPASIPDAPRTMPLVRGTSWETAPREPGGCARP